MESAVLKTIAAFLNSQDGGTLLIGVADDGAVHGLETDYATLRKPGRDDRDRFQQHLVNIITESMGAAAASNVRPHLHRVNGGDVCRLQVDPCGFPVDATVVHDENGQYTRRTHFFVRVANGTKALDTYEREKYVSQRWR